jgi:integrase
MSNRLYQQGKSAVYAHVGGPDSRYKTRDDYLSTWGKFSTFCTSIGITCAEELTSTAIIEFAEAHADLSAATQHNYHSRVSIVVGRLRPDLDIPTRKQLGIPNRRYGRLIPPPNHDDVMCLVDFLEETKQWRFKLLVELAYWGGLRRKEAILLPLYQARKRARLHKDLEVRFGTKGGAGHGTERNVPFNASLRNAINASAMYELGENLIPDNENRVQFSNHVSNHLLTMLKQFNIACLHDLRSAYACRRYEQLLGAKAPVLGGSPVQASEDRDKLLKELSKELGHGRIQVLSSYVGSLKGLRGKKQ